MKNNPINLIRSAHYRAKHKFNIFPYYGFEVYFGKYGSGKTLTCVSKSLDILTKYPNVVFITNTAIKRCW